MSTRSLALALALALVPKVDLVTEQSDEPDRMDLTCAESIDTPLRNKTVEVCSHNVPSTDVEDLAWISFGPLPANGTSC